MHEMAQQVDNSKMMFPKEQTVKKLLVNIGN